MEGDHAGGMGVVGFPKFLSDPREANVRFSNSFSFLLCWVFLRLPVRDLGCDRNWFALGVDECAKLKALGLLFVANILACQSCICTATCVLISAMMSAKSCD